MRTFDYPGCHSGQCALQQLGMAVLELDEVSDPHDRIEVQRRVQEFKNKARRAMEEQSTHGFVTAADPDGGKNRVTGTESSPEVYEGGGNA